MDYCGDCIFHALTKDKDGKSDNGWVCKKYDGVTVNSTTSGCLRYPFSPACHAFFSKDCAVNKLIEKVSK